MCNEEQWRRIARWWLNLIIFLLYLKTNYSVGACVTSDARILKMRRDDVDEFEPHFTIHSDKWSLSTLCVVGL